MEKKHVKIIVAVVVVAIIAAATLIAAVNLNGGSADFSNREIRIVITDSMDHDSREDIVKTDIKSIPVSSMVMIHRLSASEKKELRVGDVVSFWKNSELYTHRIISIDAENEKITTMGDNAAGADFPISVSEVYGKVVGVNKPLGIVANYIRTNPIPCILMVVLAFIAAHEVNFLVKDYRKEKNKK